MRSMGGPPGLWPEVLARAPWGQRITPRWVKWGVVVGTRIFHCMRGLVAGNRFFNCMRGLVVEAWTFFISPK